MDLANGQDDEVFPFCGNQVPQGAPSSIINGYTGLYITWPQPIDGEVPENWRYDDIVDNCCNCTSTVESKFGLLNFATSSDWIISNQHTYVGQAVMNGILTDHWTIAGVFDPPSHYFAAATGSQHMVQFNETKPGKGLKRWVVESLNPAAPDRSHFTAPTGCNTPCPPASEL
jgi:hypothetical protein